MQPRITQHRHHPHPPPVEDLRERLNRMREQRENDEAAGIPLSENSYLHNMPKHQRHAGFPNERKANNNRSVGKVEWDEGKTLNIKIEVSESGDRVYKMDNDKALKVNTSTSAERNQSHGNAQHSNIIKNESDPGIKSRGRGRYRGAPRGRGYFRGRGRGGFRGARRPRGDRTEHPKEGDTISNTSSGGTEKESGSKDDEEQLHNEQGDSVGSPDGEYNEEEYHEDDDDIEHDEEHGDYNATGNANVEEATQFSESVQSTEKLSTELENKLNLSESKDAQNLTETAKPESKNDVVDKSKSDSTSSKSIETEIKEAEEKEKNQTKE